MSQPATERETPPQATRRSGGSGLTRKVGPLPLWGWGAIAGGAALIWYVWRQRKGAQNATAPSAAGPGGAGSPGTLCTDQAGNVGFVDANGNCDTTLAGTGLPGGGQDAALMAQIQALQGQESTEQAAITDIQSDVGEPAPVIPGPGPCPPGTRRRQAGGPCLPIPKPPKPRPRKPPPRRRTGGGPGPTPRAR